MAKKKMVPMTPSRSIPSGAVFQFSELIRKTRCDRYRFNATTRCTVLEKMAVRRFSFEKAKAKENRTMVTRKKVTVGRAYL